MANIRPIPIIGQLSVHLYTVPSPCMQNRIKYCTVQFHWNPHPCSDLHLFVRIRQMQIWMIFITSLLWILFILVLLSHMWTNKEVSCLCTLICASDQRNSESSARFRGWIREDGNWPTYEWSWSCHHPPEGHANWWHGGKSGLSQLWWMLAQIIHCFSLLYRMHSVSVLWHLVQLCQEIAQNLPLIIVVLFWCFDSAKYRTVCHV